ncbi:hypothetical protein ACQP2Y_12450 [Actinoplanes sp. CA-051413]|uniref:hypothetical protein n=1 Tax=Actinoplanes sp. CA-051413 TaxID=3239899 RepID=UPI003D9665F7
MAAGDMDVVDGNPPVPITIWRVAGLDHPSHRNPAGWLTPRTAGLLVGSYTRPGDTIVSVGGDPALEGAAGAGGRAYIFLDNPADLAGLDHVPGTVQQIMLRWPPPDSPGQLLTQSGANAATIRRLPTAADPDGCIVVTLAAIPGESETAYHGHSERVVPAAQQGGLGWLQHIIAITAPIMGERITWRTTPADAATVRAATHISIHLDLLVFVPKHG